MAMQIMIGSKKGTELVIDEKQKQVYYTDTLKNMCDGYFKEEEFTEDDEKITYKVISSDKFLELARLICKEQEKTVIEAKRARGNEKKNELLNDLHDYMLILSVFVESINLSRTNTVYLVLV